MSNVLGGSLLGLALLASVGAADAQQSIPPTVVVVPWQGSDAPNLAAEITARVGTGVDELGYFRQVSWETLVDSLLAAGTLREPLPPATCMVGRQIAVLADVDYVLCGGVGPDPEGILLTVDLFEMSAQRAVAMSPIVSNDREALVAHVLSELRSWGGPEDGT